MTNVQTEIWNRWVLAPDLNELGAHRYHFILVDSRWWAELSPEHQAQFEASCVDVYAEVMDNSGVNFRRMLDIRDCYGS